MVDATDPPWGQDDLILRIWEGDEDAKAQIIMQYAPSLERAIGMAFSGRLHSDEVEDVVAEAIRRFWVARAKFKPARWGLGTCLYRVAKQVACEYVSGRLSWHQSKQLETPFTDRILEGAVEDDPSETELDRLDEGTSPKLKALNEELDKLPPLEREIWVAFALAHGYPIDAGTLGIELGKKYNRGVPYPAGTIRQYKLRAKRQLVAAMNKRGFDLKDLGCGND